MPNYCENYMRFEAAGAPEINAVLEFMIGADGEIDFEKLVPMPPILKAASYGRRIIDGKTAENWIEDGDIVRILTAEEASALVATGFSNWRDWSIANWGTKWNANATKIDDFSKDCGEVEIRFETVWNPPFFYLAKLRQRFPDVGFEFRFRDKDDHEYPNEVTADNQRNSNPAYG